MKQSVIEYLRKYTDESEASLKLVIDRIPIGRFTKGDLLIEQGDVSRRCYFIIEGCVRQYSIDDEGKETTSAFFTEHQTVAVFGDNNKVASPYSFDCIEDCLLLVGELDQEASMYVEFPFLETMVLRIMEANMGHLMTHHAHYVGASPEERFLKLKEERPDLIDRVPQYQLASFLGIKPESLSRIKRRLNGHLRAVD